MASPKELVRRIAELTGLPETSVSTHDRYLAEAGLRGMSGRGRGVKQVCATDAARIIVACLASRSVKDSVETVHAFAAEITQIAVDMEACLNGGEPSPFYELETVLSDLVVFRVIISGELIRQVSDKVGLSCEAESKSTKAPELANDILRGADQIAAHLGLDRRAVYHAASHGKLPVFHIGSIVHARKSTLAQWIREQERKAK